MQMMMQTNGEQEQHGIWFVTHNSSPWHPHTSSVKYQHYMLDASSNGLSQPKSILWSGGHILGGNWYFQWQPLKKKKHFTDFWGNRKFLANILQLPWFSMQQSSQWEQTKERRRRRWYWRMEILKTKLICTGWFWHHKKAAEEIRIWCILQHIYMKRI